MSKHFPRVLRKATENSRKEDNPKLRNILSLGVYVRDFIEWCGDLICIYHFGKFEG
jgi:hypothetical protein